MAEFVIRLVDDSPEIVASQPQQQPAPPPLQQAGQPAVAPPAPPAMSQGAAGLTVQELEMAERSRREFERLVIPQGPGQIATTPPLPDLTEGAPDTKAPAPGRFPDLSPD